jgi:hypothetical protein
VDGHSEILLRKTIGSLTEFRKTMNPPQRPAAGR